MSRSEMPRTESGSALAGEFLERLAAHELDRIPSLFEPDADLRALLPGNVLVGEGADDIGAMFAMWFGDVDEFELIDAEEGRIGSRVRLRWRVRLRGERFGTEPRVVEQSAYAVTSASDRFRTMSLVCSGYRREADDG